MNTISSKKSTTTRKGNDFKRVFMDSAAKLHKEGFSFLLFHKRKKKKYKITTTWALEELNSVTS